MSWIVRERNGSVPFLKKLTLTRLRHRELEMTGQIEGQKPACDLNRRVVRLDVGSSDPVGSYIAEGKRAVDALLVRGREKAAQSLEIRQRSVDSLHESLAAVLELHYLTRAHRGAEDEVHELYKANGISIDGRTKNPFTPLVKLVFGVADLPSNINRNAAALKLAAARQVEPEHLPGFFHSMGGVAKCAAIAVADDNRRLCSNSRAQSRIHCAAEINAVFPVASPGREHRISVPVVLPKAVGAPTGGLFSLLIEVADDGEYRIVGVAVENEDTIARYHLPRDDDRCLAVSGSSRPRLSLVPSGGDFSNVAMAVPVSH